MISRAVAVTVLKVQGGKDERQQRAKVKDKARIETSVDERQGSHRTHRRVKLERDRTDQCLHQQDFA